jgi:hypothetical protein
MIQRNCKSFPILIVTESNYTTVTEALFTVCTAHMLAVSLLKARLQNFELIFFVLLFQTNADTYWYLLCLGLRGPLLCGGSLVHYEEALARQRSLRYRTGTVMVPYLRTNNIVVGLFRLKK